MEKRTRAFIPADWKRLCNPQQEEIRLLQPCQRRPLSTAELRFGGVRKSPGVYSSANTAFITGPGTLTVINGPPSDYDTWKTAFSVTDGPDQDDDQDDDQDGHSNRSEYAFGQNPSVPSGNPVDFLSKGSGYHLTYTRRKQSLTGLVYKVWISTNLTIWEKDTGAAYEVTGTVDDSETVEGTLSSPLLANSKLFVRIYAQSP